MSSRSSCTLLAEYIEKKASSSSVEASYPALYAYCMSREGMEKSATMAKLINTLAAAGKRAIGGKMGVGGFGKTLSWLGRKLGAAHTFDPKTGKAIWSGMRQNATFSQRMADRVSQFGNWLAQKGGDLTKEYDDIAKFYKATGQTGWGAVHKALPFAGTAYMFGAPALLDEDNPLVQPAHLMMKAYDYTPTGMLWNAGGALVNKAVGGIQESALQGAEEAARQTATGILDGIQNKGRIGHLYGVWDPEGFRSKAMEEANSRIAAAFQQERANRGLL